MSRSRSATVMATVGIGSPTTSATRERLYIQVPRGTRPRVPAKPMGTIGAPDSNASMNPPFLKSPIVPSRERVPSGNSNTVRPAATCPAARFKLSIARVWSLRSMLICPVAHIAAPMIGALKTSFLATNRSGTGQLAISAGTSRWLVVRHQDGRLVPSQALEALGADGGRRTNRSPSTSWPGATTAGPAIDGASTNTSDAKMTFAGRVEVARDGRERAHRGPLTSPSFARVTAPGETPVWPLCPIAVPAPPSS